MERQELKQWVGTAANVFVHMIPRPGMRWIEEGIITELFSDGWFRIEYEGRSNEWHLNQVDLVSAI